MAENTLTNLIPDAFKALNVVSRELVGMIPAVTLDADVARAAIGETVRSVEAPASTASDITAAQLPPDDGEQTITNSEIEITKSRRVPFRWNGEQSLGIDHGPGVLTIQQQQIAQAIRTLTNEVEADLAGLHVGFSRAQGTAGTTAFGTAGNFTDASLTNKILLDNGAPVSDKQLVINTTAGANMLGLQASVDQAGTDSILRQGVLLDVHGFAIRQSAQIITNTAGTGSSATTNNAGYAIGATVLTLASAGTGTIVAGDVVTFAGDTNQYVVASGDTDVSDGGTITLAEPGLRVAMSAATKAITVVAAAARNMAFARSALVLATRRPALVDGRDSAVDSTFITDPRSGLTFEIREYLEYRRVQFEVSLAWGFANMKPEHTALMLG